MDRYPHAATVMQIPQAHISHFVGRCASKKLLPVHITPCEAKTRVLHIAPPLLLSSTLQQDNATDLMLATMLDFAFAIDVVIYKVYIFNCTCFNSVELTVPLRFNGKLCPQANGFAKFRVFATDPHAMLQLIGIIKTHKD
jgi:hypothetical protein